MERRLGHLAAVTVCFLVYLSVDSAAASNLTTTPAPDNNSTGGNVTNATDLTTAPTTFAATDSVAPTDAPTDAPPTMAPTDAPPTPVPPTPVPPTPVPTGGSWTDAPSTMAPVLTTDAPTTTPPPTTTAAPPVCDASPFYCGSAVPPQASCLLRTQAYIASLSCRCTAETTRLPVVSIGVHTLGIGIHTLVRLFRAEAAPTAGPLLPNSTATLFSSLVSNFVPTSTSTAQVDISAMLSSDADAATTLMTCATAIPFAAVDSASTWRGFAPLFSVATTAAPSTVTPYQIATWRDGTASAIVATRAYVYNALPSLTVMSTTFVPSTAAANSVLTVSSSMVQLRMSATAVNVTLTTNQGVTLRNQLAMPGIVNSASGSYYIVSDTVFALNMTTDDDSLTPLQAAGGTLGSISFDQISSIIQTASAKRPDIAANQTVLLQQVQCQQIRGDGTLLAISTLVTATSVSCNAVSPNALYALWIFRPSSLDIVNAVSTTAAPTTSAPIATIIQVQGSSDNAMQSLIIVLSTLGALLLIGLAGVGVLLYVKIRGQAAKADPDAGSNNKRLLEFHEVNNSSTLLEVAAPRALSNMDEVNSSPSRGNTFRGRDPSVHSSSMLRSPERAFSPIKSVDGDEDMSVAAPPSEFFAAPSFAVPSPLPPRVFIDAELQFVPKRRPGAVVAPENDPTPWL